MTAWPGRARGDRADWSGRAQTGVGAGESEEAGDVFAHLVLPERPVVAALGGPVVEGMADVLAGGDWGQAVGGRGLFPGAGAGDEVDVAGGEVLVGPRIGEVREVVDWIVEVEI